MTKRNEIYVNMQCISREGSTRFSVLSWVYPVSMLHVHIYAACPCPWCMSQYMLRVIAMSMDIKHGHGHEAWTWASWDKQHGHANAAMTWKRSLDSAMQHRHEDAALTMTCSMYWNMQHAAWNLFYCDMSICIVQASYSQLDGVFIFIETFTACNMLLPILKCEPAYFIHHSSNYVKKSETLGLFF